MPRRNDIQKILVIGSGPIVIGQSAEFDYSGTQACKALKQEGYEVVLVNSNPATIMTDPDLADRTYVEPLTREYVEEIIRLEEGADGLHIQGIKALFLKHRNGNVMDFIVGNEIYDHLERVMDRFEDVANCISGIVIEQA